MDKKKPYRFTGPGKHSQDGKALKVGDIVSLTDNQAKAFRDRFRSVDESEASPIVTTVAPVPVTVPVTTVPTVDLDDDNKNAFNAGGDDRIEEGSETRSSGLEDGAVDESERDKSAPRRRIHR